jgi:Pvc16 N-terminal domain/IPT/TIG domain
MSNSLAIGAVSATLKYLLEEKMVQLGLDGSLGERPIVTLSVPGEAVADGDRTKDRLNLFLYQTTLNQGWRNVGMPALDSRGERVANPPLALDLHYLLTAFGQKTFHAELMLGYAMNLFHQVPVLTRDDIRKALKKLQDSTNNAEKAISSCDLADQIEQIKIIPQSTNTEELWKLWSAMQSQYHPTVTYQISVVLIESQRPTKSPLPVATLNLLALPFNRPSIESISPPIPTAGAQITIVGQNLQAEIVEVSLGAEPPLPTTPPDISAKQIQVTLPTTLKAGINTVQVLHRISFGTTSPDEPHRGFESNVLPFMLAPRISLPATTVTAGQNLTISIEPPIEREQRVSVIIGDRAISIPPRPIDTTPVSTLGIPIATNFPPGTYLLRLRVDGAESPLEIDRQSDSPTFNQYIGPKITIV